MQYLPSSNHSSTNFQPRNDLQETMQEASYLSLSAMAERTDRQPFPTEGLSFMTLLRAATGISGSNPTRSVGSNASLSGPLADFRQSFFANNKDFKQLNVGGSFQRYMEYLRSSFPFISNNELKLFYENVISCHERDSLDQLSDDSPEQLLLTYIGIATGILLSPDYHYREALAAELSVESLKLMSRVFDHANDLAIVSCMTALTIYSLFTTFGGSTWHLLGLTMMRCISSGMHTTRVSNAQCDNEEKRKSYRIFWVLYILDTYVSTTLDRPFCLNDHDILVSPPSSPRISTFDSDDDQTYRYLIQHAQILRSIRQNSGDDVLCQSINLRHWKETLPNTSAQNSLQKAYLFTRGYVELLKQSSVDIDPDHRKVVCEAESEFLHYLKLLETHLDSHSGAISALEAIHVFAIGIISFTGRITTQDTLPSGEAGYSPLTQHRRLSQLVNLLTLLATRYSAVRSLRDILMELLVTHADPSRRASNERLRELIGRSEILISNQIQTILLGPDPPS
ncbi:hypothetical protein BS50DRAFT_9486 [Corynespora cassiicola Philippines]|uniref:Xylanolytic transcriptional activator regulatory domain-containing protein n=1 Tax=Corynespora cassiicola Philippines TaxID=1448308 RepID=A0A2T2P935_CORCC|nr:hypothetical protein BS50DRAFT_9486 [Corynespora cassiicola Philippines]